MLASFKSIFIVLLLVLMSKQFQSFAQTETETFTAKKAVYLEVGGSSGIYAINYSKIFHQKGKLKLNASAGFSMLPRRLNSKTTWLPLVPVEVSAFYGKSNHHLELGFGLTSYLASTLDFDPETLELIEKVGYDASIPLRIGYRYQKPEGGFFFRVGYTPIIDSRPRTGGNWSFYPYWAGVSFGKSF
ncbi:hypothetical protein [Algoriphagus antarcticus]|uniref:Outer membrane protein with beta-barrel domain n=1 Tax=Algoriphagus antarcticus TaxID=238540 RepID=A0A3E0E8G7_9BACT|nr:hypothetical protein [Algoriphagus antarcticus]REG94538.1 hypothetical protein C8N25_101370 [Algoriphagus antarcticus]